MRSTLNPTAPSPSLLRYLKAQFDGLACSRPRHVREFNSAGPKHFWASSTKNLTIQNLKQRSHHIIAAQTTPVVVGLSGYYSACHHLGASRRRRTVRRGNSTAGPSTVQQRFASTQVKWLEKIWKASPANGNVSLHPDDLPKARPDENNDSSIFSLGRHISAKAAAQPKLRCTEIDENGNVVLASGEFKKSELIAKYGLLPRDLRKIDSSLLPHILIRPSAILINLLHLRVLIKSDRVLVFDAYGTSDSFNQSAFIYDLEDKLRHKQNPISAGGLPYEFRALESVLLSVITSLEAEFEGVRTPVVRVLRDLEEDIDRDKLRLLLIYSKKLGTFEQRAKLVRDAIDELLDADDDLASMYLTEKSQNIVRGEEDHTEVEMLLESYHKLCDEIVQESGNLVSNIRNTEEIVKAILDANRNSLMLLDLKFSIGTLGIGSGAFIAALYGMNLKNYMEESDLGFMGITGWSLVFSAVVCAYGLSKLRKVQRLSMWGESGRRGRSWRDEDSRALFNQEIEAGRRLERQRSIRDKPRA
ncbi:BgTH12-05331 [Blumeria graminis f. sp. triticale]|uniref:Magnesium transporter n=3 Tax=Blumeria graminis TaxID=34373 RepID=A0A381L4G7_BLUGR|nr:Mitochondrial inner membrane magnesium transporter [Blumeria graminis f. sp. tritici 96224]CAD6502741.1 BgTH12-05331 [Blumeria graminis f. sp. triticale]VDB88186.1 Bgt-2111 [Blumeria graminis f. sp. tritici]